MPATNFHEYARGIEDILDATVTTGVEAYPAPTLARVVDKILRGTQP